METIDFSGEPLMEPGESKHSFTPKLRGYKRLLLIKRLVKRVKKLPMVLFILSRSIQRVDLRPLLTPKNTDRPSLMDSSRVAEQYLDQLAGKFLNPCFSSRTGIRVGTPAREILTEAGFLKVDLIVLTSYGGSSIWKRPIQSKTVQAILNAAPCDITLLPVRTRFNCEQQWELVDEIVRALNYVSLLRPGPKHS